MTTIYLVTQGSYSDYQVIGAFSTREEAEKVRVAVSLGAHRDEADIEEYKLDSIKVREGYQNFRVFMTEEGDTRIHEGDGINDTERTQFFQNIADLQDGRRTETTRLVVVRYAKSVENVVKIANELRTRWLASKKWPVGLPLFQSMPYDLETPEVHNPEEGQHA